MARIRRPRGRLQWASLGGASILLVLTSLLVLGVLGDLWEPLGDFPHEAFRWIRQNGPLGAFLALYGEESGVPVLLPGDIFVVYIGRHANGLPWVVAAWLGLIVAVVLGATNLYWISRRWGRGLLEGRLGRVVHLTPDRLARAEGWFGRYGAWALIIGRHIPGCRIPITIAAGTLQVRYRVFATSVAVSSAIWTGIFLLVGMRFGRQFERTLAAYRLNYSVIVPAVVVLVVAIAALRHDAYRRGRLKQPGAKPSH